MRMLVRTRRIGLAMLFLVGLALIYPTVIHAKVDMFLKIADVKGESRDDRHEDWFDAEEFLWGQSMPEDASKAAGQTGVDRPIPGRLTITKRIDRASPQLAELKAKGSAIPSAVLDVPRRDGKPGRMITTMTKVKIVALTPSADGRSEKVTLAYQVYRVVFTAK